MSCIMIAILNNHFKIPKTSALFFKIILSQEAFDYIRYAYICAQIRCILTNVY